VALVVRDVGRVHEPVERVLARLPAPRVLRDDLAVRELSVEEAVAAHLAERPGAGRVGVAQHLAVDLEGHAVVRAVELALEDHEGHGPTRGVVEVPVHAVEAGELDLDPHLEEQVSVRERILEGVREAGGEVVDLDGRNLDMPIDPMARTNVIAYGDKQVLEMIR